MPVPNLFQTVPLKRTITEYALLFINVCGGFPFWRGSVIPLILYYVFLLSGYVLVIALSIGAAAANVIGSFLGTVSTLNAIFTTLNCMLVQVLTVANIGKLANYLRIMDDHFFTYRNELKDYRRMLRKGILTQNWILFLISYGWVNAVGAHLMAVFLKPDLVQNPFILFYVSWIPWRMNSIGSFLPLFSVQVLSTVPHELSMLGSIGMVLNTLVETQYQFKRLICAIENLMVEHPNSPTRAGAARSAIPGSPVSSEEWRTYPRCSEREFNDRLKECVKHFQILIKAFNEYKSWFEWIFAAYLLYGTTTFGLLAFTALGIQNAAASLKYLSVILMWAVALYIYCNAGELISSWNNDVMNALYNIPWYELTPKERKHVLIFLCATKDKMALKGMKIYPASLAIFATVMKISYSYFNLLRTYEMYRKDF